MQIKGRKEGFAMRTNVRFRYYLLVHPYVSFASRNPLMTRLSVKGGLILRVRQRCDEQYNCCDGEAILLRNHCFFVASLLSFLVRVA